MILWDFVKIQFLDTVYSTYLKWLKGTIGHHWIARHHKHIPLYGSACLKSYFWILNFAIHFMKTYLILHATQLGLIVECPHKCIHLYWKRENKKVSKGEKVFKLIKVWEMLLSRYKKASFACMRNELWAF